MNGASCCGSRPQEARKAQKPASKGDGVGADGVEARELLAARDHLDQQPQPRRALGELDEAVALRADGGAEPGHHVGDIAELLQDGVVGDGAHARRVAAVGGVLALPLHRPRADLEQEVGAEGAEQRPVARVREQVLLIGAQAQLEIERQIDVGIERVLALARVLAADDDGGERARRRTRLLAKNR